MRKYIVLQQKVLNFENQQIVFNKNINQVTTNLYVLFLEMKYKKILLKHTSTKNS